MEKTLAVPLLKQVTATDCGIAVAAMAYGLKLGRSDVDLKALVLGAVTAVNNDRQVVRPGVTQQAQIQVSQGIHPNDMGYLFAQLGICTAHLTYPRGHLSFELIQKTINAGMPILTYIQLGLQGDGHYILIVGYGTDTNKGNKPYLVLHDPAETAAKYVYYENYPANYYSEGSWGWYESWILSWAS
jgi:Papain-like cysteine protease AvrRpt2